jgi:trehalose 6-phosphate synthase
MSTPARPVLVASNRGPVSFRVDDAGQLVSSRGQGGLVTALTGAMQGGGGLWVAAAMSDGDREMVDRHPEGRIQVKTDDAAYELRYLSFPQDVFDGYYNNISNGLLWFAHHYLWDTVHSPLFQEDTARAWEDYIAVNREFARTLAEEGTRQSEIPIYLVQDYHLSLVPRMLRELRPDALIAHFSHTPIAGPTYLRIIPDRIRDAVLRGLLGADVLGFHSEAWAENFLMSCRYVSGARVDLGRSRVVLDGREILVRVHPISVDAAPMRELASSLQVRRLRQQLNRWRGNARLILRVDRMELSKNIYRGFIAYEAFLMKNPSWKGRVKFLALLSPSRQEIPEYRTYTEECIREAERVNAEFGTEEWTPIEVRIREDYLGAIAAYGLYDVLMVNPVYDGMNLVAMEGPVLNRRHGVLVLSRNAGAYFRLGRYAIGVNPFDIEDQANALEEALEMSEDERTRRARGLSRLVLANPPSRWIRLQLDDIERVRRRRGSSAA